MVGIYVVGDASKGTEEGSEECEVSIVTGCVTKKESVFGESGMFVCGPNNAKQLGVGKQAPLLARWSSVNVGRAVRCVAPGSHHSLLCTSDGAAFSCGRGDGGQLGLGDKLKAVTSFQQVVLPSGSVAKQVAVASSARRFENQSASYVLTSAGACLAFGNNNHMKLGLGAGVDTNAWNPAPVAHEGVAFEKISAGKHHVLACDAAGYVYSWGSGDMGRLGLGDKKHRGVPTKVELGVPLVGDEPDAAPEIKIDVVVARETFSVAFSAAASAVYTWGFGTRGQLGRGGQGTRGEPASPGRVDLGAAKVAKIAANDDACLAFVENADDHLAWGSLELGTLKLQSHEPQPTLQLATPLANILAFDLSNSHALVALRLDLPDRAAPPADPRPAPIPPDPEQHKRPADEMPTDAQPPAKIPHKLDDLADHQVVAPAVLDPAPLPAAPDPVVNGGPPAAA